MSLILRFFQLRFTYRTILAVKNESSFEREQQVEVKDGYQVALQNI